MFTGRWHKSSFPAAQLKTGKTSGAGLQEGDQDVIEPLLRKHCNSRPTTRG